ncbi:hypothetical protein K3M67_13770 [Sphingobium sp. V4]|uniref:hypothetical protein n=1 Tax=unclassified Sphingobium TaxID=2611147 RepID=UPI0025580988|nr:MULTISPECIES: hypothetical protein [unclassified Sphingobium]WIW88011.1 hypothetical protein K3M67_13770 [Sphingobium sp. V4]
MNHRRTGPGLAAAPSPLSAGGLVRLHRLGAMLETARDKIARGETLSRADRQRLNAALDAFAA